jgi:hypothetical protein
VTERFESNALVVEEVSVQRGNGGRLLGRILDWSVIILRGGMTQKIDIES